MALFGTGIADMFKDVVPTAAQGYGENTVDWASVKPFQVIKPMGSWAATNAQATAPSASTDDGAKAPVSAYEQWLQQQSGKAPARDGSGGVPSNSNLTDAQWADIKAMRDAYGWDNPVDQAGLKGFGMFTAGMLGAPGMVNLGLNEMQKHQQALSDFQSLNAQGQTPPVGYKGDSYGFSGGFQSAPAEPQVSLTPEQTQAMVDSLSAAGYYGSGGGFSSTDGGYGGGNVGGGYTGAGADRD